MSSQNLGETVNVPWHQAGNTFVGASLWFDLNDGLWPGPVIVFMVTVKGSAQALPEKQDE